MTDETNYIENIRKNLIGKSELPLYSLKTIEGKVSKNDFGRIFFILSKAEEWKRIGIKLDDDLLRYAVANMAGLYRHMKESMPEKAKYFGELLRAFGFYDRVANIISKVEIMEKVDKLKEEYDKLKNEP